MHAPLVERKLAAIFAADVAGYSRLMSADETGTLAALKARRAIIDRLIAEHRGRIFNTAGDSVVADFASAVDAVQCAVAVQKAIDAENANLDPANRMQFRIGVHVGDVMVDGENLLGDGVNIAARLEGLAEPGTICLSGPARDHVGHRLPVGFDDLGAQRVKNIPEAIRVYRVRPDGQSRAAPPPSLAVPGKPSVAVLPFTNMSADQEQEFLADGIAEDVITALARYSSLFVIARNSSFTYKGQPVEVRQVGRDLGVRYVLEGSLRKAGNRIRVTAQLIEAASGNHIWAERYDRDLADIFAVPDEITESVTIAMAPAIDGAEQRRALRQSPESLDAWTAYQRGLWHIAKASMEDYGLAETSMRQAIKLDPNFCRGYAGLSLALTVRASSFPADDLGETLKAAEQFARQAAALDGNDAEAHKQLALSSMLGGDFDGALQQTEIALSLSPNLASAHGVRGATLVYAGRPVDGLASLQTYFRLDPRDPVSAVRHSQLVLAHYHAGNYEAAAAAAEQAIRLYPGYAATYRNLAAALGQLGRREEAERRLAQAIALAPEAFRTFARSGMVWHRPEQREHLLDGLKKAGWEDHR